MKVSKRGEYAARALVVLAVAQRLGREVVRISEITALENIPTPFLEQIFMRLREAGLVESRRGKQGGYKLAKPADNITLGEVMRLMDGPIAPLGCVSRTAYEKCTCPEERLCALRAIMLSVRDAISSIVDKTTFANMAASLMHAYNSTGKSHPLIQKSLSDEARVADPSLGVYEI